MTLSDDIQCLDRRACYRALQTRDARFDGRFYTAVSSTRIYCRPICPARTPKLDNCVFVASAAAAHQLGFRPCLRCRPELAPGIAGWRGSANTVSRALTLIAEGALDQHGVDELAERLGVGSRQLRRLFDEHLGAAPIVVAQAQRVLFAKKLITDTSLRMTEIALAAGFGSVRRFNDAMRRSYGRPPLELRRHRRVELPATRGITLQLSYTPPFDWPSMLAYFRLRAVAGVERVEGATYTRAFRIGNVSGLVAVKPVHGAHALSARVQLGDVRALGSVVTRFRCARCSGSKSACPQR